MFDKKETLSVGEGLDLFWSNKRYLHFRKFLTDSCIYDEADVQVSKGQLASFVSYEGFMRLSIA